MIEITQLPASRGKVPLRIARGHFATSHSHINYYIDIGKQKSRLSEAKAVASDLAKNYNVTTAVDTVLCIDGMGVIGACLADEMTRVGGRGVNERQDIFVIEPEFSSNGNIIFRDNIQPMVANKRILVLMASVTTGRTADRCLEAVGYYGGTVVGVAALYSAVDQVGGVPVNSVYSISDLPDYESYNYRDCPMCKAGRKLDALVNSFGYSSV